MAGDPDGGRLRTLQERLANYQDWNGVMAEVADSMRKMGALEENQADGSEFRWNPAYDPTKPKEAEARWDAEEKKDATT